MALSWKQEKPLNYFKDLKWSESRSVASESLRPRGLYGPWNSPGQKTGVGSLSLLQWIFPTWGSNPGLLNCRWILYQLSHKGSPSIKDVHIFKRRRNGVKLRELEKRLCVESWVSEPANFWTDFKLSVRTELVGLVRSWGKQFSNLDNSH